MSTIEVLTKENQDLKNQISQLSNEVDRLNQQVKGQQAQCKAYEQLSLDHHRTILTGRTNLVLMQEHITSLDAVLKAVTKENDDLKSASDFIEESCYGKRVT